MQSASLLFSAQKKMLLETKYTFGPKIRLGLWENPKASIQESDHANPRQGTWEKCQQTDCATIHTRVYAGSPREGQCHNLWVEYPHSAATPGALQRRDCCSERQGWSVKETWQKVTQESYWGLWYTQDDFMVLMSDRKPAVRVLDLKFSQRWPSEL
jgi:hypothetical protein